MIKCKRCGYENEPENFRCDNCGVRLYSVIRNKGQSLLEFPDSYVVIDLETTGWYPDKDEILEFAGIRIENGAVKEEYSTLIKPEQEISEFISDLTGITNEMVANAPTIREAIPRIINFIGDSIIVGHNVNFDINFLYDTAQLLNIILSNDYVDTMRLSRKLYPEMKHHRLGDIARLLHVDHNYAHRAMGDCKTTNECLNKMYEFALQKYPANADQAFSKSFSKRFTYDYSKFLKELTTQNTDFDTSHPLYDKVCVFTGALEKMTRTSAMQIVADLGGKCSNSVTRETNFLILGNNDYCSTIKDGKSNKHKKAEEYRLKGCDIEIIPEDVFYEMLDNNAESISKTDTTSMQDNINGVLSKLAIEYDFPNLYSCTQNKDKSHTYSVLGVASAFKVYDNKDDLAKWYILFARNHVEAYESEFLHDLPLQLMKSDNPNGDAKWWRLSYIDTEFKHVQKIIKYIVKWCYEHPIVKFDCCDRYEACSDAKRCVSPFKDLALNCGYRAKLSKGIIFYGKNRNV